MKCSPLRGWFFLAFLFFWVGVAICFVFMFFFFYLVEDNCVPHILHNTELFQHQMWQGFLVQIRGDTVISAGVNRLLPFQVVLLKNRFTSITLFAPWKCWPVSQSTTLVQTFMMPGWWILVTLFFFFFTDFSSRASSLLLTNDIALRSSCTLRLCYDGDNGKIYQLIISMSALSL